MEKLKLLNEHFVAIKMDEVISEMTSVSGIKIINYDDSSRNSGIVILKGNKVPEINIGDKVLFGQFCIDETMINDKKLFFCHYNNIKGIIL